MRIVLQRVTEARVEVNGDTVGAIGPGLVALVAVAAPDTRAEVEHLASKVTELRIFSDESGKMNRSLLDVKGSLLVISQFTLYGDCRKGRRPNFDGAAPAAQAKELYEYFVEVCRKKGLNTQTGVFQAHMAVHLVNDGPVTIICGS